MNIKIRLKNPTFWVQIFISAFATALAYAGLTAADMTTWGGVWNVIVGAFSNPYCLFLVASSVWNALNDPTTINGILGSGDSSLAKTYTSPKKG